MLIATYQATPTVRNPTGAGEGGRKQGGNYLIAPKAQHGPTMPRMAMDSQLTITLRGYPTKWNTLAMNHTPEIGRDGWGKSARNSRLSTVASW